MAIENLVEELHQQALSLGAAYFGVADLIPVQKVVVEQGGSFLARFPKAVSIGLPLAHAIVDQLYQHQDSLVVRSYRHHIYFSVTQHLDQIALRAALKIQQQGYQAFPVRSTRVGDESEILYDIFSHKLAAHLAGLGWIGKNSLLVTPERGVRIRWVTVLTDAPLPAKSIIAPQKCGKCQACVDICPVHAYTGVPFSPDEPLERRFNARKCSDYLSERGKTLGVRSCGLCVYACPVGKGKRPKAH